jgi:hypothetical protein
VTFYSRPTFKLHHLHASHRAFERIGASTFMEIDVAQAALLESVVRAAVWPVDGYRRTTT